MRHEATEPAQFVIFGATGDLARRKLLPALCRLVDAGQLHPGTTIVGVARQPLSDTEYRGVARDALRQAGLAAEPITRFVEDRLCYQPVRQGSPEDFRALGQRLETLGSGDTPAHNRAFYMSLPPRAFSATVAGLSAAGLHRSEGWTRLVVEKPFGRDLASAGELNELVHRHFDEEQIYRIDHYLGKDTVRNLLVFRFANALIESAWNRDRIDSVQITVAESLGVGTRAGYYDHAGALRDMVQNHLTQLLTLVAMEVPATFSADAIRQEKIKVLKSIAPIRCEDVVRGQYTAGHLNGERAPGYLEEEGIAPGSGTETFVAMKLGIDNWRWNGVPFFLRSGKRMPRKTTQIAVRFRDVPVSLFRSVDCVMDTTDVLTITLQPHEGFALYFDIKIPGERFALRRIPLDFDYGEMFDEMPEAYQTLLLDVLDGDQTLFVHAAEVEESWRVYTPLLEAPPGVQPYAAGTWGPDAANALAIPESALWQSR